MMIYPVPGRLKRDPQSMQPIPEVGRNVPDGDVYWLRALRDGDVTATAPAHAPAKLEEQHEQPDGQEHAAAAAHREGDAT